MFKKLALAALAVFAFQSNALAQDGWAGEASLTASNTTGNTETTDVGLGLKLAKEADVWRHKFDAIADFGEVSGTSTKERYALGYQIDRDLNERTYVYGNADYFNDKFGAFVEGYFVGGGLGYKAILPEPMSWNLEGGLGFRSQEDTLDVSNDELAARGFSDFDYALNDNVSLYNDTEIIWSDSDTYIWNDVGITAQLMGNLAARLSFRVDHHTDVPVGTEKTDTALRGGIVYTIG